jgi:hypothetical protein
MIIYYSLPHSRTLFRRGAGVTRKFPEMTAAQRGHESTTDPHIGCLLIPSVPASLTPPQSHRRPRIV